MVEIILIELISVISFLYSFWLMFFYFAPINEVFLVFIWTVVISLFFALNHKKRIIYEFSILLLLLPLIFYHEKTSIFFIIVSSIFIYLYIKTSLFKGKHYQYANQTKKTYIFYILATLFRFLLDDFAEAFVYVAPFITINILSSIILTRSIRHLDSNMDMKKIRKNNIRYLTILAIIFIIAIFEKVRTFLWYGIHKILDGFLYAVYYPLLLISKYIERIFANVDNEKIIEDESILEELPEFKNGEIVETTEEQFIIEFPILKKILGIILIAILLFIVYKLIMKAGNRDYIGEEFTEEREYIKKKKKWRIFNREKYPKDFGEQIRYYYRRYLDKLDKGNIKISKMDTSLEVNEKAEEVFSDEIEDIRDIYINTRYGEKEANETMVEKIKTLYKNL